MTDGDRTLLAPFPEHIRVREDARLVTNLGRNSAVVDQYRNLAQRLDEQRDPEKNGHVITVVSEGVGVGKTLTSLNLALTFAKGWDRKVLLIEGDADRPTFQDYFAIENTTPGLVQVLQNRIAVKQALLAIRGTGLKVVVAGTDSGAGDLIAGPRAARALAEIKKLFSVIIVDCPPLALAAGRSLAMQADSIVLVVRSKQCTKKSVEEALTIIGPSKKTFMVLNDVQQGRKAYYEYYYAGKKKG